MYNVDYNYSDGFFIISDSFDLNLPLNDINATPQLNSVGDEYVLSFPDLQNIKKIIKFSYDSLNLSPSRYLLQKYRISRDSNVWSEWYDLNRFVENFPLIDTKDPLYLEIKWTRHGIDGGGPIRILKYSIEGEIERDLVDDGSTVLVPAGDMKVIRPPYIFKIFNITDLEIISPTGIPANCSIKYRYSQDSTRTWSDWEVLTSDNISTKRISPIRFFQIEYLIENESNTNVRIQDINLIGDFQNLSNDYQKTNLFGIRECCQSNVLGAYDANGNFVPNTNLNQTGGGACPPGQSNLPQMSTDEKAQLYNPYQQNTAVNLLTKLSTDAQQLFGHKVKYFCTDPDKKGQDHILNEYSLYNVVCEGDIKVSINGNNFPDSQIVMNQFDLNLFETMEAHITKQQFKEVFGIQRRPSKEDFLYFCDVNRMYQVDHAQQFRNFNNSAVYYKLILKKFTQKANIQPDNIEIKNKIEQLTKNTTIEELFGNEIADQKASIANKPQLQPLTKDPIRLEYRVQIDKELIENSSTIISKSHYDMSSVVYRTAGVIYKNLWPSVYETQNIGFQIWFNINNYIKNEFYNFINYYDETEKKGYKIDLMNDEVIVTLNSATYSFHLTGTPTNDTIALEEEVWHGYICNIDQRNRKMSQYFYKRNVDLELDAANLPSTILRRLYKNEQDITPFTFEARNFTGQILGSDMKLTNMRLFVDIIPESEHTKMLNQYVVRDDSKYLVLADNATTRLYLPRFPLFE